MYVSFLTCASISQSSVLRQRLFPSTMFHETDDAVTKSPIPPLQLGIAISFASSERTGDFTPRLSAITRPESHYQTSHPSYTTAVLVATRSHRDAPGRLSSSSLHRLFLCLRPGSLPRTLSHYRDYPTRPGSSHHVSSSNYSRFSQECQGQVPQPGVANVWLWYDPLLLGELLRTP